MHRTTTLRRHLAAGCAIGALVVSACTSSTDPTTTTGAETTTSTLVTTTSRDPVTTTTAPRTTTTVQPTTTSTTTTTRPRSTTTTVAVPDDNEPPTVTILAPTDLSAHTAAYDASRDDFGTIIDLAAEVSDPNGDPVTVTWSSTTEGPMGTGTSLSAWFSTLGSDAIQPVITATATDQWGASSTSTVHIIVWIPSDT